MRPNLEILSMNRSDASILMEITICTYYSIVNAFRNIRLYNIAAYFFIITDIYLMI
jgi:hypothetical protein